MHRSREILADKLIISGSINELSKITGVAKAKDGSSEYKCLEMKPLSARRFSLIYQNLSMSIRGPYFAEAE